MGEVKLMNEKTFVIQNRQHGLIINPLYLLFSVTGVGWAVLVIAWYVGFSYNVVIAWSFYYLFASFTGELPWRYCDKEWNTPLCFDDTMNASYVEIDGASVWLNYSTGNAPAKEYFE